MANNRPISFEKGLARLQEIVAVLEESNVSLEESVTLYKEGLLLVSDCREQLDRARLEISIFKDSLTIAGADDQLAEVE